MVLPALTLPVYHDLRGIGYGIISQNKLLDEINFFEHVAWKKTWQS